MFASPGPGLLRQMLLVVVVGLIVARPFVLGEDPGMLDDLTDPTGLVLVIGWLAAAAVWGAWRIWARQDNLYAGLVEAGLGAVVILVFGTAYGVAAYQHPARLIAWEWLAMFFALFLVRQLTVAAEEQHGLMSALLAMAVTLSAFGVWQAVVTLPNQRALFPTKEAIREAHGKQGTNFDRDDPHLDAEFERVQMPHVYGTYAHPNSFAGVLALLLPALVGAAFMANRNRALEAWQKLLAAACALLGCAALWLTHSRGAILAAVLVIAALGMIQWRRELLAHKGATALATALGIAMLAGMQFSGMLDRLLEKKEETAGLRTEYWSATLAMIGDHPWFGVGPGNFGREYTRYMAPTASDTIKDPHNFIMEIWATSGVFALVALLVALGGFFAFFRRVERGEIPAPPPPATPPPPPPVEKRARKRGKHLATAAPSTSLLPAAWGATDLPPVRWSFYFGGMFGLLLAFMLQASYTDKKAIVGEAIQAGVLSIIWFAAFALFEQIEWTPRARALTLGGGALALLFNLLVSGGLAFPQVATLLWVVVGLALNALTPQPLAWLAPYKPALFLPLPFLIAAPLIYLFMVMLPVSDADSVLRNPWPMERVFKAEDRRDWTPGMGFRVNTILEADVIPPLEKVVTTEDKDNTRLDSELAQLWGRVWFWSAIMQSQTKLTTTSAAELTAKREKAADRALKFAIVAQQCDPDGPVGYQAEYRLRLVFANFFAFDELGQFDKHHAAMLPAVGAAGRGGMQANAKLMQLLLWDRTKPAPENSNFAKYKEEYRLAADVLLKFLPKDPNNPQWHYAIADALYREGDRLELAKEHAIRALTLDAGLKRSTSRKLTDPQRRNLDEHLAAKPGS